MQGLVIIESLTEKNLLIKLDVHAHSGVAASIDMRLKMSHPYFKFMHVCKF